MAIPTLDISEIFEEAFDRAGGELKSGHDLKRARRCLNLLTHEWANRGLNLWTLEEGSTSVTSGDATYSLDSDTIDILEHAIRDSDSKDFPLTRIKLSEWASKNDKSLTGQPTQIFVQRSKTTTNLTLWPVPNDSFTLVWWRIKGMDGLSSGAGSGTSGDFPPRFTPAIISGLAYHLAQGDPSLADRAEGLFTEYERQFDLAAGEDRERASVRLVPRIY